MADASIRLNDAAEGRRPAERVWVLDDPWEASSGQAIGVAERLGLPFRRIPLSWNWRARLAMLPPGGSLLGLAVAGQGRAAASAGAMMRPASAPAVFAAEGPALALSSGPRSAAVALWLKARFGTRLVQCMRPGLHAPRFDLLVIGQHDRPAERANILPVLGVPHRLSPLLLRQAAAAWEERLAHLPHPRVALLVGGPVWAMDMQPALAHSLGLRIAALVRQHGGSVLATTSRRTGREATDALAAGLGSAMNVLYRWGEPGENPYHGFLASADAIVVTGDSVAMLSEACATAAPVFVALPELGGARQRRLHASLFAADHACAFDGDLAPWRRTPLDEAGRVAAEIRRRFALDLTRIE